MPGERVNRRGPWFWVHPVGALAVAGVLAAAILALRLAVAGAGDEISNLYALPVALLALTSGRRVGLIAGAAAAGLILLWVLVSGESLTPLGWACRVIPLLLLGGLVGDAADRIRGVERTERRATALEGLEREAAELHDEAMQHLAVAKWRIEAGDVDAGLAEVTKAMEQSQALVGELLGRDSLLPGDLRRAQRTA